MVNFLKIPTCDDDEVHGFPSCHQVGLLPEDRLPLGINASVDWPVGDEGHQPEIDDHAGRDEQDVWQAVEHQRQHGPTQVELFHLLEAREALLEEEVVDEVEVNCKEKLYEDWQSCEEKGPSRKISSSVVCLQRNEYKINLTGGFS